MPLWTVPADDTYHLQADRSPHSSEHCSPECRRRGGKMVWFARGTEVDPVQRLYEAMQPPPGTPSTRTW